MTEWLLVAAALAAGAAVFHKVRRRPALAMPRLTGTGAFAVEAVSDERHRATLRAMAADTAATDLVAVLRPERSNRTDPDAIRVDLAGKAVGYLPVAIAGSVQPVMRHRAVACGARIVPAGTGDDPPVRLALDITLPPALAG
jgi:hypothetical protein